MKDLLERLELEFFYKYHNYPEGEKIDDFDKRKTEGNGFLNAIKIVSDFMEKQNETK